MWNEPCKERLAEIPRLYETENVPLKEKLIHLHFFIGACDWYIAEYDGVDLFWGFAILNNDYENAEWGYISLSELKHFKIKWLEIDCEKEEHWPVKKASEISKIRAAHGWPAENPAIKAMEDTALNMIMDQAVSEGLIEVVCLECGITIQAELDAARAWCGYCGRVVKVRNILIESGMI